MIEVLAQIEGVQRKGRFTAGLVLWDDKVIEAPPIVRYMKGWTRAYVRMHCYDLHWTITVVHQVERHDVDAQGRAVQELRAMRDARTTK
jgi:hypothetical protein